jgi:hypothetical protein
VYYIYIRLALDGCAWLRLPSVRSSIEDEELLALNRRAGVLGSLLSLVLLLLPSTMTL